jgi:hypothetical protein
MIVQEVPLQYVNMVWPSVEGFIASAIPHSGGDITLEETKSYCVNGVWKLLVAVDEANTVHGAVTLHFFNRINHRVAFITTIGGKGILTPENFSQFSDILRSNGATCMEGSVRDSLVRMAARFGAKKKSNNIQLVI